MDVEETAAIQSEAPVALCDLYSLTREELVSFLEQRLKASSYRAGQIFRWLYRRRKVNFAEMTDIAHDLRGKLGEILFVPAPQICDRQISRDGSRKYLFATREGGAVESVMIKQPKRMTLCISSQVGCGMGCAFCRTATMGLHRNLTAGEIVRQVVGVIDDASQFGDMFENIVFMGMGEPLHNYKSVTAALKILTDPLGLGIAPRKITVSSVGLVPAIEKFGKSGIDVNLAISLNATTDEVRSEIMPINRAFPIEKLLHCLRELPRRGRKKITIEYVMLAGVNDSDADLRRLPKLLEGIPAKVNLIPYNSNAGLEFQPPSEDRIKSWQDYLTRRGICTTIRWSKGRDIDAACGQLAVPGLLRRAKAAGKAEPLAVTA